MPAGPGRDRESGPESACEPSLLPPGGHAAAGEAAGGESAAERVQQHSESPHAARNSQDPMGLVPPALAGALVVRALSPEP